MRILIVHNQYQQAGGEDIVVNAEKSLLENNNHQVHLYLVNNHRIKTVIDRLRVVATLSYSQTARQALREQVARFQPNIVHVHNFFPLLTPSIYDACAQTPVVQTLHNYRTICPGAFLMRQGQICETCVTKSAYHAVRHGCYRQSKLATLAVAQMVETHRRRGTWQTKVSRFIALTEFARQKFISAGFSADQLMVKPNFATDPLTSTDQRQTDEGSIQRRGALYVGRLSEEKGIITLLKAWNQINDIPLRIAGKGELDDGISQSRPNVTFLGWQTASQLREEMRRAAFLVMPSQWYEGFPMVLIDAFWVLIVCVMQKPFNNWSLGRPKPKAVIAA
jgi:glycosyltransferase involved in cell wall biosynthesis